MAWVSLPWLRLRSPGQFWLVGFGWLALTLAFEFSFGLGPKVFQRIMRLQRVRWLANTSLSTSLTWLAMESGYADQAHLCREVRTLTGQSPTRLLPRQLSGVALSDLFNSPLSS